MTGLFETGAILRGCRPRAPLEGQVLMQVGRVVQLARRTSIVGAPRRTRRESRKYARRDTTSRVVIEVRGARHIAVLGNVVRLERR